MSLICVRVLRVCARACSLTPTASHWRNRHCGALADMAGCLVDTTMQESEVSPDGGESCLNSDTDSDDENIVDAAGAYLLYLP